MDFRRLYDAAMLWVMNAWKNSRWAFMAGGGIAVAALVVLLTRPPISVHLAPSALDRQLHRTAGTPLVIAFYEPSMDTTPATSSFASLASHYKEIDVVAPYWFRIGLGGVLENHTATPSVVTFAHRHGVKVWPLVGNNGFEMLTTVSGRRLATHTLVSLAKKGGYDGIFLDWELVPASQRHNFNLFVADVATAFHGMGKAVAVAVFPKIGVVRQVQGVYDYPVLAHYADAVAVMTYDHHENSSPPGAVAPLNWVVANMHYALQSIPRAKLFMGIATYGYDWTPAGASTVTARDVKGILGRLGIQASWSLSAQEPHFSYVDASGVQHTVWYENATTFAQKLGVVKRLSLAGVAVWRIGGETPKFWQALATATGRPTA